MKQIPIILYVATSLLMLVQTGCATNDELFAKYDKTCEPRAARVITSTPTVNHIERVEETVAKEPAPLKTEGLLWEPAVYFGYDHSNLSMIERKRLSQDITILQMNPSLKVNIQAFTDVHGSSEYNKKLALRRQDTVQNYITTMGIDAKRILLSPLGEELAILDNSVAGRKINRRVELMLLDNSGRPLALKIKPVQQSGFQSPLPVR